MRAHARINRHHTHTCVAMPVWRMHALTLAVLSGFLAIAWQLTNLGADAGVSSRLMTVEGELRNALSRPELVDRNGRILASDIKVYWLFADPSQLINADETVEKLSKVLPVTDLIGVPAKLRSKSRFEWVKRGLAPNVAEKVHNLGLPGLFLIEEPQRVYPAGKTAAHILGHTDVDNKGLAGIENYVDREVKAQTVADDGAGPAQIRLALDLRVQHALHEELTAAKARYRAEALGGLVLDVKSGEVVAMAGLPDYDPNDREQSLIEGSHNRFYYDAYELGSVFKAFAVAMALEEGIARVDDKIDVLTPIRMGRYTLHDRHARKQFLTVEEVFTHSSNTGAARLALAAGGEKQKAFFAKLGLMDPLTTELGPTARPLFPKRWREVNTMTAAYGHGLSVPPFTFAVAAAALINGGFKVEPTFLPRSASQAGHGERVLSEKTSAIMRELFFQNVEKGTGRKAKLPGYSIGGKTGTAWKPVKGGYSETSVITSFVSAFPMDNPKYLVLIIIDEPKPEKKGMRTEAGYNAAPTTGLLIERIAPMLGIAPSRRFDEARQASY